jgi:heterodisulfide reductase subunit C
LLKVEESIMPDAFAIRPDGAFLEAVEARSGEKVCRCFHCRKCTNGCPLAFAMDFTPNQVMRMIQFGLSEELLRCATIWICASCQTCTTRCPNDIDVAHVMDTLRQLSREADVSPAEGRIVKFHEAFLHSVRRHGRLFELGMVGRYKMTSRDFFSGTKMGLELLKRGKLKFLPAGIKGKREIREMFEKGKKD